MSMGELIGAISAVVTLLIGLIGGMGAYILYRKRFPRTIITQHATFYPASEEFSLMATDIVVKNTGNVLLKIREWRVQLSQVLPPQGELDFYIRTPISLTENSAIEVIEWHPLLSINREALSGDSEIEPGEEMQFFYTFLIPSKLKLVLLRTELHNENKRRKNLIWHQTTIHSTDTSEPKKATEI